MNKYDLWHIKIGTQVKYIDTLGREEFGIVIKREINEECYGLIITKNSTKDLKTGKKFLTVTINFGMYNKYIDTMKPQYILDCYSII